MAAETDKPVAGLLKDLKRRGLLDRRWCSGAASSAARPKRRAARAATTTISASRMWMAGGGIRGGETVGATDAIGLRAVEEPYHFRDIHTTILHQLGLDQDALSYLHLGRRERLTEVQKIRDQIHRWLTYSPKG